MASSGTVISIKKALENAGNTVNVIDGLSIPFWQKLKKRLINSILKKEYDPIREPSVLKKMNKAIFDRANDIQYDIVFSQTSVLCAYYTGNKPIVFYTDAAFGGMLNYYVDPETWYQPNLKNACDSERLALERCSKAIYASDWAANAAVQCHGASPNKCVVINRGANIEHDYNKDDIKAAIECRNVITKKRYYKMLFVGRDWERKGGPFALEIVKKVNELGYQSKLVVVGCNPIVSSDNLDYIESVGFLNKAKSDENKRLQHYFLYSDFYLQPSKHECQGIAYTEASAFGLPVFANNTGGVSGVVTKANGCLMQPEDTADTYANKIIDLLKNEKKYRELAVSTFNFYEEKLNWKNVGERITQVLESVR